MEKGIVTTAAFHGDAIEIENGIGLKPNLRLKSTYIFLSKILGG